MSDKNYITPPGLQKLRAEYGDLLHKERPKVVETVAWAASNGDRSENADYIYGKKRLREIDRRLRWLGDRIEKAEVVDPAQVKAEKVVFGATVTVSNDDGEETVYQIVGEDETDVKSLKISWKSPVARALMGKKEGDEAVIQRPAGPEAVVVEKILYK